MPQPTSKRLLTEATAAAQAKDPATPLGGALAAGYAPSGLPSGVAGSKRFDPATQVYNLTPSSLRRWRSALAAQAGAYVRLNCYGDSITWGATTASPSVENWPARLRAMLKQKYGTQAGTGVVYWHDWNTTNDPSLNQIGTWEAAGFGPFGVSCASTNTPGSKITFTPPADCDSFTVHYLKSTGCGTFTMSVDGGAATNVDAVAATTQSAKATIAAGASGPHTLTVTAPTGGGATGYLFVVGIEATNGSTGVRVTRCAKGGAQVSNLITGLDSAGSIATAFDLNPPTLAVLAFGMNEYLNQASVASFKADMQTAIDRAKVTNSADVLLVATIPNADQSKPIKQADYRKALYELADANNVPLLDLFERWGDYTTSNAAPLSLYGDLTHPNGKGYYDIAAAVFDVVAGR